MRKEAAITVRLPVTLKKKLAASAERQRRSLSAQIVTLLEQAVEREAPPEGEGGGFLGRFEGGRVPSDDDIQEVRGLLWGSLGSHDVGQSLPRARGGARWRNRRWWRQSGPSPS